jgi:hypothetical protein
VSLLAQLDRLAQYPDCQAWSGGVKELVIELCRTSPANNRQSAEIVERLESLAPRADELAAQLKDSEAAEGLRRARYALGRRLLVWAVLFNNDLHSVYANAKGSEDSRRRLSQALADAQSHLQTVQNADAWRKYLLLDQVAQIANSAQLLSADEARPVARQVISRLTAPQASDAQRQALTDASLQALVDAIRPWASESTDVRAVLAALEQYEASGLTSDGRALVTLARRLNWSPEEKERALARQLDLHYRNANIRVVLTADLINRVAPDPPPTTGVVNDTILNARVNGSSQTTAQLLVKLIPDPLRLHFQVGAEGSVNSLTQATHGPVTFESRGEATFVARKTVILDRDGTLIEDVGYLHSLDQVALYPWTIDTVVPCGRVLDSSTRASSCLARASTMLVPSPDAFFSGCPSGLPAPLSQTVSLQFVPSTSYETMMWPAAPSSTKACLRALITSSVTIRPMLTASLDDASPPST